VVVDGKLITSLAAGSAMEFAYEIVRQLRGGEAVSKLNQGVLAVV
jgi:4-methyl-5(b-hydroxyethyl)-thiazole monophosphate biosynthesis